MNAVRESLGYFSSDCNAGTLICTNRDGAIVRPLMPESLFVPDTQTRKDIKFYPPDDRVFTTTGATGLEVWDAGRDLLLYRYKSDTLSRHAYSTQCILAAFDAYNIKFYDLRCRYVVKSCKQGGVVDLGWVGDTLFTYDGDRVSSRDYRDLSAVQEYGGAAKFTVSRASCYFMRHDGQEQSLVRTGGMEGSGEVLSKKAKYDAIYGLRAVDAVACLEDGKVRIEEPGRVTRLDCPEKIASLEALHLDGCRGFLFANDNLYEFEYR